MKDIYSKEIFYEGHDKFIKLLYYIEMERKDVDLTVKRHNLYIQGKMARDRKYNPSRLQNLKELKTLEVDHEEIEMGKGLDLKSFRQSAVTRRKMKQQDESGERQKLIFKQRVNEIGMMDSTTGDFIDKEEPIEIQSNIL